ncbi:MAG: hypothetical protein KDC44_15510, partial [Phaeodactylibacter sp.]|nr:hypothetical protein [Phaeodactylibacter sp.]
KWLHSPAHNQREDVQDLFEYLTHGTTLMKPERLEKTRVFEHLFPKEAYDDARMRQVIHFMLKPVEEFLAYQEWIKDESKANLTLAKVYRQRQLQKSFTRTVNSTRQFLEKQPYRNKDYHQYEYQLQYEEYNYRSGLRRTVPLNLQEVSDALDLTYLTEKLRQTCLMVSHQTVFKTEYNIGLLDEVLRYVEDNKLLEMPALAMYYHSYKSMVDREDESHFQNMKQSLFEHGDLFPDSETRDIYLLAMNYCIGRINTGVEPYRREAFELYRYGLERGILLQNGLLSRFTFLNVVTSGTLLKEFEWTQKFIHEYEEFLEEQHRASALHYSLGKLHFEKKEYGEAMRQLTQVEFEDIHINLYAKTMLLKMYYELDEFNAFDSLLESMRMYLRRKKVLGYHKSNYKNIINFTKKLVGINPYDNRQKQELQASITEANPLTERKWLLSQIEGL